MAELDVQPKQSTPWLWLLIAFIAIVILFFLVKGCHHPAAVATTEPAGTDWNTVDFNAAKKIDADITDTAISVSGNDQYRIYSLGENILFATGQDNLQGSAADKLKQVTASINKNFKGARIGVYGNTDSTGTAHQNQQLGTQRASAVKDWLVKAGGLDSNLISIHSLGENKPVASNATAGGRQQNRNVSIVVFNNK